MSGMKIEDDTGTIEINFNDKSIRGECKAGKWKEHFDKVRKVVEGE